MLQGLEIVEPFFLPPAPKVSVEEASEALTYRIGLYRLLSGVFIEESSVDFLAALRQPESLQALAEAGLDFDADFLEADLDTLAEQLAVEYTTLFGGSGGFPPIESARLTGRLKQEPYFGVQQTYAQFGFSVGGTRFAVFEDQLGVELAFVAAMLERCAAALIIDDQAEYRRLEREVKRFWTVHLGQWVRGFSRLVQRATEHSFYREMARLLEEFADDEIATMRLRIEDKDQGRAVVPKSDIKVAFDPDEPVCGACTSAPRAEAAS